MIMDMKILFVHIINLYQNINIALELEEKIHNENHSNRVGSIFYSIVQMRQN